MISTALTLMRFFKAIARSWGDPVFRSTLVLAALILLSGSLFYHSVEGWSWLDSLYFSVMTATTIGVEGVSPATSHGKLFTIFYALVAIGVFIALVAQIAKALINPPPSEKDEPSSET